LNEAVTISYRLLRADGELVLGQFQLNPLQGQTAVSHAENMAEGFLLSVSCQAAVATQRGMTFLRVFLTDPALGNGQPSYSLFADYVTNQQSPAHPNGRVLAPTEGPGLLRTFTGLPPALGAEWVINPPFNIRWRVMVINAFLTTSAVVANRTPRMTANFFAASIFQSGGTVLQPASKQYGYAWSTGLDFTFDGINRVVEPLPDNFFVNNNGLFASFTNGLDPGDQWTAPVAFVEEWLQNV
jgi:hypothetical protein